MPDVVVLLLLPAVGSKHGRVGLECLVRVGDDRQRLVVDEDRRHAVGRGVARRGDDRGDLLALVHDGVGREHHLHVAGQGRHPVELVALEVLAGDHRQHARDLERLAGVDALDRRVRIRRAGDVEPQLAGQVDVVDVLAGAADEARILLALDRVAHATDLGAGPELAGVPSSSSSSLPAQPAAAGSADTAWPSVVSAATTGADSSAPSWPDACWIDFTMFT